MYFSHIQSKGILIWLYGLYKPSLTTSPLTIVWNIRDTRMSLLRSIQLFKPSTISSPTPTPHLRSFYSSMLHCWGVRYQACVLLSSQGHIKTSVSACTAWHCLCVKLWAWMHQGNTIFQLKACVHVKMCIWVDVPVCTWNQTFKYP